MKTLDNLRLNNKKPLNRKVGKTDTTKISCSCPSQLNGEMLPSRFEISLQEQHNMKSLNKFNIFE